MWNMLIPVAPVLIVTVPGLWRNICPVATFSLLPRRMGISLRRIPSRWTSALLTIMGLTLLLIIVPFRHISLNSDGPMTAALLLSASVTAFAMGTVFEWRSGWCNSLCPIHPVEKLYGLSPAVSFRNMRCDSCGKCTVPCPDSTRFMNPSVSATPAGKIAGHFMIGSFSGFIWGWYQMPDYHGNLSFEDIILVYFWPFTGALISLGIYILAGKLFFRSKEASLTLIKIFATLAVSIYYWYRIPALAGFGPHPGTGLLYDLSDVMPLFPHISHIITSSFFIWFLIIRKNSDSGWMMKMKSPTIT
jgi:hypothetical protein